MKSFYVIDNDLNSLKLIKTILKEFPDIIFKGNSDTAKKALNDILKINPKIIFIDISKDFHLVMQLLLEVSLYTEDMPFFVALSKNKNKAYEAYQYDFFDFILKPITELSIRKSILKYKKKDSKKEHKVICLKSYKDYRYLDTDNILYLKADNNTTDFIMTDGTVISAFKTLKTFENLLPSNFLRIHKSYIINSSYILRINYGKSEFNLKNISNKIPFTKTFIENVNRIKTSLTSKTITSLN